jgi:hypothetical protein
MDKPAVVTQRTNSGTLKPRPASSASHITHVTRVPAGRNRTTTGNMSWETAAKEGMQKAGKVALQHAIMAAVTGTVDDITEAVDDITGDY